MFVLVGTIARVETGGKNERRKEKESKGAQVEIPETFRENKKRRATSSIPVETPPRRERATRSQKKQSEAELEKALKESKRKAIAKGKKKVSEPIEAIEIEEMDPVLHDEEVAEEVAEEVEIVTLKAKKINTSKKKSPSKTKSAEPYTLAKRTTSAMKSRKLKVVEEEESKDEEESDKEKEKMLKFGKRTIFKGRLLSDLEEEEMMLLLEKLQL
ncbi:uncharacterized protein [Nicotiana sylvestris]|uniref:uncharacterized protein n=1 Tax=Nicotiana sylvestris TaxID=4096 RepID=UPI00388C7904